MVHAKSAHKLALRNVCVIVDTLGAHANSRLNSVLLALLLSTHRAAIHLNRLFWTGA
jgi:hypothetical protein